MMKKVSKLLMVLTAAPLLASCGVKAEWRDISYERVLSGDERIALVAKVSAATYDKISKIKHESSDKTRTKLHKYNATTKEQIEFFKNGEAQGKSVTKSNDKLDGKTAKTKETVKSAFVKFDEDHYALFNESSKDEFDYQQIVIAQGHEAVSIAYELNNLILSLNNASQFTAVENKKGEQFFIYTDEAETFSPVQYGKNTKVKHDIRRVQNVAKLNKDFSLKSLTRYDVRKTNRDPDTQKFYASPRLWIENKETYKFSYDSRSDAPSALASYRDQAKNGWVVDDLGLNAVLLKADGTELGSESFDKVLVERKSYNKTHFVYKANLIDSTIGDDAVDSLKIMVNGYSYSNSQKDDVAIETELKINNFVAGYSGMSLSGEKLKMGKAEAVLTIEFDAYGTKDGAEFKNVVAYAETSFYA